MKNLLYLYEMLERRPKEIWKISLGHVHIMMFYGRPEKVV